MILHLWNWIRKNVNLVLLLVASFCLAWALGDLIQGARWSLLVPVTLSAVVCSWGLGGSRSSPKQAWVSLTALGIPGVFIYVGGLALPLGRLILSVFSLIPQVFLWMSERVSVDLSPIVIAWSELTGHIATLMTRLWEWSTALLAGIPYLDPFAAGLAWSILLWLVGAWTGWRLRRDHQALQALAPGGALLALVLDYTREDVSLLVVYLAILLLLMGLARDEWRHLRWGQRKVDYAESIRLDTLVMVGMVTIALTLSASGTPSISWRDLVERLRRKDQTPGERVAESLGLEAPKNVATSSAYRSEGLPRQHLLETPPDQLQDVVMTVSTGELPPIPESVTEIQPNRYYWRAITYDVYTGRGWSSSAAQEERLLPNTPLLESPQGYRAITQIVKRVPEGDRYVYWTGILAQSDSEIEIAWRTQPPADPNPLQYGDMLGALTSANEYVVLSYLSQFSAAQLREAGSDYPPQITRRYLGLPEDIPERVLSLARELTRAAPNPYERAIAIEAYLRNFPYTLEVEPPPPDRDVVDYFLFTAQQGYCDYYASAMVVLARAAGLPARLVIGYASGDYDAQNAEYIIRQEDAHSWAEVYFAGLGWVEFEPTSSRPVFDRPGAEGASGPPPSLPATQRAFSWLKEGWRTLISNLGGQLLIGGMALALLFTLWQLWEMIFLSLLPSQNAISRMYSRLEKSSARLLPNLPTGHTPYQLEVALANRLKRGRGGLLESVFLKSGREIEQVVGLYVSRVFSPQLPTKAQTRAGVRAWLWLRWRLWFAIGWERWFHL